MSVSRIVFGLYIAILSVGIFVVILITLLMSPFFNEILSLWNELVAVGLDNVPDVPSVFCRKL